MNKNNFFKNLFLVILLAGYALICLSLYWSGKITYYVHPDFAILALISGLFLAVVLFFVILSFGFSGKHTQAVHDAKNMTKVNDKLKLAIVVLPILMFIFFRPKVLSSQAFNARSLGSGSDLGLSRQMEKPAEFVINTENRSLIDWIRLFSQNANVQNFVGMKAHLTGFVIKDGNLPDNYFMLSRFVISCCAADARPVGLVVKYDNTKYNFKNDEWVDLKAVFAIEDIAGQKSPVLMLNEAKEIEVPANPYIS